MPEILFSTNVLKDRVKPTRYVIVVIKLHSRWYNVPLVHWQNLSRHMEDWHCIETHIEPEIHLCFFIQVYLKKYWEYVIDENWKRKGNTFGEGDFGEMHRFAFIWVQPTFMLGGSRLPEWALGNKSEPFQVFWATQKSFRVGQKSFWGCSKIFHRLLKTFQAAQKTFQVAQKTF